MKKHLKAAQELMDGKYPNVWVCAEGMDMYLRHGLHFIDGRVTACLDIANVLVSSPGKGLFTEFLDAVEALVAQHPTVHYVFVENIMNQRLAVFLRKRGYVPQEVSGMWGCTPSMYKYFGKSS